jgi:enoyl-CoA hydratase/carnithine racemase
VTPPDATTTSPTLSIEGPVARITLARPARHNAIEVGDIDRIRSHLTQIDEDQGVRVLVVTGLGPTFCAGASLQDLESGKMTGELFETFTDDLAAVRVPTICALNGSVYGGGTELALCCDFRVGVLGTRMSVPAARLGLCYPLAGLRRYVEALGLGAATRLLLAGEEIESDEMLGIGFLHRLVPREELDVEAGALARRLASLAPLAVQAMKRIVRQVARGAVDEQDARRLVDACAVSTDLREGIAARRERRDPVFRGR